ncbi:MAG: hypothetical protein A2087_12235 [Spirochaetes bacterium GWD1_61_31]|nr:MAG: hypothetical protein A2Y37_14995 [Spirochaetes bacterium GWB1_60_80]OHD33941.1 MAG: hypothetical protein A2004_09900 [Spirochaetes bacterium GWC1_61_12]OHD35139.1 MAG: hypothetical protein A2087_12235 [Spirochaetes bacterium GWD1_61_31]OHD41340.1 MAG: hypothetical protein A2Y35_12520 [Spirochaetes bacterium GWE1_60_18]OHD61316.1 MAG: hypothetical protein A2Y32_06965 [Spirochaetes bacterium GWF1_60_12]HAP44755.1 hypothetical protein [Spirochaetaceae bacterium]
MDMAIVITDLGKLRQYHGSLVRLDGRMSMESFQDKGGRQHDWFELWLTLDDGQLILLRSVMGPISKQPITHRVRVTGRLFYGNVDSDDPRAQSRVGYRLDFSAMEIVD